MTISNFFSDILYQNNEKYKDNKLNEKLVVFDFIRGLAVFFMVFVHVLGVYSTQSVQYSAFGHTVDFLGSPPAAPVFMFSMGVFFILSSKSDDLKSGIIRGVKLLILGSLLSFLRFDLLQLVDGTASLTEAFGNRTLTALWEVDILQFAGCAYILMSLIKTYLKKPIWWLGIALCTVFVSPLLWGITSSNPVIDWIMQFLWGMQDDVYFPIFGWLCYPLIGMILGVCLKAYSGIDKLLQPILKTGIILLFIGSIVSMTNFDFHIGDYFHSGPGSMIWITGFVLVWLWASHMLLKRTKTNTIINHINSWGKDTSNIYFIHWIIVMWGTLIFGYEQQGIPMTILLTLVILFITHQISKWFKKRIYLLTS